MTALADDPFRPGVVILMCRCGEPLTFADMRRYEPPRDRALLATLHPIRPIVCALCSIQYLDMTGAA
jgi:hypothetical protein